MQQKTFETGKRFDDNWEEMINLYQLLSPAEQQLISKRATTMLFTRKLKPFVIASLVVYIVIMGILLLS